MNGWERGQKINWMIRVRDAQIEARKNLDEQVISLTDREVNQEISQ
jgi:hypothetical protein